MINIQTIYARVRHWLFWYGTYGFCSKSSNDEITLYSDQDQKKFLGYFELTTVTGLINLLKYDMDIIGDDKEYRDEIESFINGDEDIHYHYIYPRDVEDVSRQVPHSAPTNVDGYKPVYIDMWTKISKSWDIDEIMTNVRIIAKDFLGLNIENVELIDIPTYEETKISYEQDYKPFVNEK
ncbi:hypothetical protein M5X11_11240 [Paenibacillus alginolyticus]|uniref:Uncharacterized protein n=1 Tax=Paenibacillus alginolyticus TaxID=59839 RepID=A0ABT4GPP9_9BACL|nr:hypothetical protein [Paenibacillus alginolyticus]MCY9665531.1 hypothetical protein [Paenibacillus alginolyticus]MCY9697983.1 hypothetical protein [Paenibacillus alginolyticus]MEC0147031.1 hypothetical protein [Paenibacillus alginolyticus]